MDLSFLIGRKVFASIEVAEDQYKEFKCRVLSVFINSFHFEENGEPIYVEINLEPLEDIGDVPIEDFSEISLNSIRKAE